jgi:hypothetical protein
MTLTQVQLRSRHLSTSGADVIPMGRGGRGPVCEHGAGDPERLRGDEAGGRHGPRWAQGRLPCASSLMPAACDTRSMRNQMMHVSGALMHGVRMQHSVSWRCKSRGTVLSFAAPLLDAAPSHLVCLISGLTICPLLFAPNRRTLCACARPTRAMARGGSPPIPHSPPPRCVPTDNVRNAKDAYQ